MKTKTKLGWIAAGIAVATGVAVLLLATDNGKKIRKTMKKKANKFFDEADTVMARVKEKVADLQEQLDKCENKDQ